MTLLTLCACLLFVAGCTGVVFPASVRESSNLGVLAPFEGLYRRTGYAALESVRSVITDPARSPQTNGELWIPLALDTSRGAQRAAEKMIASGRTYAIVGPLDPAEAFDALPALAEAHAHGDISWILPFARVEDAFVPLDDPHWLAALLQGAVEGVRPQLEQSVEIERLVIAGYDPFSAISIEALAIAAFTMPVDRVKSPAEVPGNALLLWLGNADEGVRFAALVRSRLPETVVWFPQWAANDVLQEHAAAQAEWRWQGLYWSAWMPASTQAAQTVRLDFSQAQAELLHAATVAALQGAAGTAPESERWVLHTMPVLPPETEAPETEAP